MRKAILVKIGLIVTAVALVFLPACADKPGTQPPDQRADFSFDYYQQGNYDAFPLNLSHVQGPYDGALITLQKQDAQVGLAPEKIIADELHLRPYMDSWVCSDSFFHPSHPNRHVFGIEMLLDPRDTTKTLPATGVTFRTSDPEADWGCFVAVGYVDSTFAAHNHSEVASFTTTHELGHLISAGAVVDCRDDPSLHDGACLMMDIGEAPNMTLRLKCGETEYPYTHQFCNPCLTILKDVKYQLRKL